ncbi:MAG: alpha/beta fold hydrolase [Streptosporangiaceae bacterium]
MTDGESGVLAAGDLTVAYTRSGTGEPLVLLHGAESNRHQYDVFRPLLGPGISAIAYDQRDCGDTVNGTGAYDVSALAADCAAFVAALGFDRAHIAGSSLGGAIALTMAVEHPDRVQSLVLGATPPDASVLDGVADDLRAIQALPAAERRQRTLELMVSPDALERDREVLAAFQATGEPRAPEASARRRAAVTSIAMSGRAHLVSAPTLVINGSDDPLVPVSAGIWLAGQIPGARFEILPGARHAITLERRTAVAALVRDFVLSHPMT